MALCHMGGKSARPLGMTLKKGNTPLWLSVSVYVHTTHAACLSSLFLSLFFVPDAVHICTISLSISLSPYFSPLSTDTTATRGVQVGRQVRRRIASIVSQRSFSSAFLSP